MRASGQRIRRNAYPPARSPANAGRGPGAVARLFPWLAIAVCPQAEGGAKAPRPTNSPDRPYAGVCASWQEFPAIASETPLPVGRRSEPAAANAPGPDAVWHPVVTDDQAREFAGRLSVRADCSHTCLAGLAGVGGDHRTIGPIYCHDFHTALWASGEAGQPSPPPGDAPATAAIELKHHVEHCQLNQRHIARPSAANRWLTDAMEMEHGLRRKRAGRCSLDAPG